MSNDENYLEIVKQMRYGTFRLNREGEYWTLAERDYLAQMFMDSVGITEMAIRLQRREQAIIQQLGKLGLYDLAESAPHRQRAERKPVCLCNRCQIRDGCPFYQAVRHIEEGD